MTKDAPAFRADLAPVVVVLPTEDRRRSFAFYANGLGLEPVGELAAAFADPDGHVWQVTPLAAHPLFAA